MKKYLVLLAAMMMVIAMVSGAFAGTATDSVPVTAKVTTSCTVTGGSLDFGTVDADSNATGKSATAVAPTIKCTKGLLVTVTDDLGANEATPGTGPSRMTNGTSFIVYTFSHAGSLIGTGIGNDIGSTLTLAGSFAANALDGATEGNYTDAILLTLTY